MASESGSALGSDISEVSDLRGTLSLRGPALDRRSVGGKEISGGRERGETTGHIREERQVWKALDVGFKFLAHLCDPSEFLLEFLQKNQTKYA